LFGECKLWLLFNLIVYLFTLQDFVQTWSPSKEVFLTLFSHSLFRLCILLFVSFDFVLQVPPSLKGIEFIEQELLEEISKKVFSLFPTLHDIVVSQIFCILQVDFVPTCAQV
jgi:hypothetical protein